MEQIVLLVLSLTLVTAQGTLDRGMMILDDAKQIQTLEEGRQIENVNTKSDVVRDRNSLISDQLSNVQDSQSLPSLNMMLDQTDQHNQQHLMSEEIPSLTQVSTSDANMPHSSSTSETNEQLKDDTQTPSALRNNPRVTTRDQFQNVGLKDETTNPVNALQVDDRPLSSMRSPDSLSPMSSAFSHPGNAGFQRNPYQNLAWNGQSFMSNGLIPLNNRFTSQSRASTSSGTPGPNLIDNVPVILQRERFARTRNEQYLDPMNSFSPVLPTAFQTDPMLDYSDIYEDPLSHSDPSYYPNDFLDLDPYFFDRLDENSDPYFDSSFMQSHDDPYSQYLIGRDSYLDTGNEYLQSRGYFDGLDINSRRQNLLDERYLNNRYSDLLYDRRRSTMSRDPYNTYLHRQRPFQTRVNPRLQVQARSRATNNRNVRRRPIQYPSSEKTVAIPFNTRYQGVSGTSYWDS